MALLTVNSLTAGGMDQTLVSASAGGDTFPLTDGLVLVIKNGGASAITATVKSKRNCSHGYAHDSAITINAGATKIIGNLDDVRFKDPATGLGEVQYSGVTTVTVGVFKTN